MLIPPRLADMLQDVPRFVPLLGLSVGYLLLLWFNPIRPSLRDGFRCIMRFKRIWRSRCAVA